MRTLKDVNRAVAVVVAVGTCALAAASCGIEKQSAPALAGPSEYGTSLTVSAIPNVLVQDGESQSVINVLALDANGGPIANLGLRMDGSSSSTLVPSVTLTATAIRTDAAGRATFGLVAPPPPAVMPTTPTVITVRVTPEDTDLANTVPRTVQVQLVAPSGTPMPNNNPVPSFTIVPAVANITQSVTFDASATTDEGTPCGSRCTYLWDFGDFTTGNGITVTKSFTLPQAYNVTLTVQDDRGGVASTQRTITISGPAAPSARERPSPSTRGTSATEVRRSRPRRQPPRRCTARPGLSR
jgi:hypothetical protein